MQKLGWKPQYTTIEPIVESAWNFHQRYPRGYESPAST
jgi:UDP-glucose 4-epimerase